MTDISLKVRHVKRSNDTKLDLSNMDLNKIPEEIKELFCLERINISGNKISNIDDLKNLHNL